MNVEDCDTIEHGGTGDGCGYGDGGTHEDDE
jgi:hypothetical protein